MRLAFSRETFNSDIISASMERGKLGSGIFNAGILLCHDSSICCEGICILSRSLAIYVLRSYAIRMCICWLFDSIFVPSIYSTSRLVNFFDARMRTILCEYSVYLILDTRYGTVYSPVIILITGKPDEMDIPQQDFSILRQE